MLQLARRVHANSQKVVLTGEGANECLAGYPWYKMSQALGMLNLVPWLHLGDRARRAHLNLNHFPQFPAAMLRHLGWSLAPG